MDLAENFKLFFKSFNPKAYKFLTDRFLDTTIKYWIFLFVLSFLVMLVLFLPIILTLGGDIQEKANQIDDFYLEGHVTLTKPVVLVEDPLVLLDFNRSYPVNEKVLITNQSLFFKKYYLWGDRQIVFSDIKNLRSQQSIEILALLGALIIPTLLILLFLFFVVKDAVVILLVCSLGWIITNLAKQQLSYSKSLKVAIHASTLLVFLEFVLFPFWRSFWLPLALFVAYYVMGVVQVAEKKY